MINLLVADDHELFIEGLRIALEEATDINIKNTARNGYEVKFVFLFHFVLVYILQIQSFEY